MEGKEELLKLSRQQLDYNQLLRLAGEERLAGAVEDPAVKVNLGRSGPSPFTSR
jgi:hypothetical protein